MKELQLMRKLMRKRNECKKTRALCARATAIRATVINHIGGIGLVPGTPDRFFSHIIWSGFIEFKDGPNKISNAQYNICRELLINGDSVYLGRFDEQGNLTIEDPVMRKENGEVLKWADRAKGSPMFEPQHFKITTLIQEMGSISKRMKPGSKGGRAVPMADLEAGIISPLELFKALKVLDSVSKCNTEYAHKTKGSRRAIS